ncbi:hypothetical protein LGX04_09800 [Streptococcus mutans]|nr:hypothetical protein [Streptococcus mutans]
MSKRGGYSAEDVATMSDDVVANAIETWCVDNDYTYTNESECVTLTPRSADVIYLER